MQGRPSSLVVLHHVFIAAFIRLRALVQPRSSCCVRVHNSNEIIDNYQLGSGLTHVEQLQYRLPDVWAMATTLRQRSVYYSAGLIRDRGAGAGQLRLGRE